NSSFNSSKSWRSGMTILLSVEWMVPAEPWNRQRYIVLAGAAAALIAISAGIIHSTESKIVIPDRQDFDELKLEFGPGWKVEESVLDVNTERVLNADDHIVLNLESPEGDILNLYVAYLVYQKDGGSWHSPQQCLPGGGWRITQNAIVPTSGEGVPNYHYNRMIIKNGDDRFLVHYYYDQRGRRIANEFMMKFALVWDVLTQRRSDGAMIRLMTPILAEDGIEGAEERMRRFQRQIEEMTPPYIPA
ncbi:MAG: exosortase C-terminal domain/associated protein EpsI, partial [Pseudomonadota bacterium]